MLRAVAGGVAGVALLAGCVDSPGSAGPTTTVRDPDKIEVFNPCRGALSDEVLRQVGLDPATKLITTDPPTGISAWRICDWAPTDDRYGSGRRMIGVGSTSHTLEEARTKKSVTVIRDTTVNARPGLVSKEQNTPDICYVSFEAQQGLFEVTASWLSTEGPRTGDLCTMAEKYAAALEPHLPE
ncbi:DUF3558 domain-containing protein [Nocardia asteroides]|uniref:DUF3558 domain-containing protein n=1 Tax=Nocardia asteroides TaxID=1824 RepID=UPI001E3099E5|nr:DUF3558 domain-containing protein [Nocardia asteroides]UGT59981.1 DUF3558 domain-containing protein [Nocardia asteroides]